MITGEEFNKGQRCGKDVGKLNGIMQNFRDNNSRVIAIPSLEGTKKLKDTRNQKKNPLERGALKEK